MSLTVVAASSVNTVPLASLLTGSTDEIYDRPFEAVSIPFEGRTITAFERCFDGGFSMEFGDGDSLVVDLGEGFFAWDESSAPASFDGKVFGGISLSDSIEESLESRRSECRKCQGMGGLLCGLCENYSESWRYRVYVVSECGNAWHSFSVMRS